MTLKDLTARISAWLRNLPAVVAAGLAVLVVLAAGTAIILQSESSYQQQKSEETQVQGEILAASIVAALDFGDSAAAQEAAEAMRVNRQIRGTDREGNDGLNPGEREVLGDGLQPVRQVLGSGVIMRLKRLPERVQTLHVVGDNAALLR